MADVSDPALRDLLTRTSEQVAWIPDVPGTTLRAWRRAGWARGAVGIGGDPFTGDFVEGEAWSGLRLEDEVIDRVVLRRRGVSRDAEGALLTPLAALLEDAEVAQSTRTHTLASSVRAASAAVMGRGA